MLVILVLNIGNQNNNLHSNYSLTKFKATCNLNDIFPNFLLQFAAIWYRKSMISSMPDNNPKYKKLFFPFLSHLWDQISTMLSSPHKYPSSWLPSCQGDLWSSSKPSLRATVFPKSIIHTLALPLVSWTNNRELPMTCNLKQSKII